MKPISKDFIGLGAFIAAMFIAAASFAACGVYFSNKYGLDVQKVQIVAPQKAQVAPATVVPDITTGSTSKPAKPHKNAKKWTDTIQGPTLTLHWNFDEPRWTPSMPDDLKSQVAPYDLGGDITGIDPDKPKFTPPPAFDDQDRKEI